MLWFSSHTFSPVSKSDLAANEGRSNTAGADVFNCIIIKIHLNDILSSSHLHSYSLSAQFCLTLCDGACSTGFSEAIALAHRTTETHIHESLSGWWQGGSSRQHHPHASSQEFLHFLKQQPAKTSLLCLSLSRTTQACFHEHWRRVVSYALQSGAS